MRISRPGAASAARVNSSPMPTVMRSDSPHHPLHRAAIALAPVLRRQHRCAAGYAKEQHLQHKGHLPGQGRGRQRRLADKGQHDYVGRADRRIHKILQGDRPCNAQCAGIKGALFRPAAQGWLCRHFHSLHPSSAHYIRFPLKKSTLHIIMYKFAYF